MTTWLLNQWNHLRSTFWFVPTALSLLAIALAFTMVKLDEQIPEAVIEHAPWLWAKGPDGALSLLSTIAGSMITIAGVVFSITIVALTLASAQFGPRLLRNFMRDPGNQISLGTFIATFLYCLLVIRSVKTGGADQIFVPYLSITVALLLAVASLGVLIYFMHHVAVSIQAPNVVDSVASELKGAIPRLFPCKIGDQLEQAWDRSPTEDIPTAFEREALPVKAVCAGYVQAIDGDGLMNLAKEADLLIRIECRPGHFVVTGSSLVTIWPGTSFDETLGSKINGLFYLGPERTSEQDVEYVFHQLVEVAIRALSPGINDPFTAINCIDRLGEGLCYIAERAFPSPYRYDEEKVLRVIAPSVTFQGLTEATFNQIRQHGRSNASVTIRLLEIITLIATFTQREEDRYALREQAIMIKRGSETGLLEEKDRLKAEERYRTVMESLGRRKIS